MMWFNSRNGLPRSSRVHRFRAITAFIVHKVQAESREYGDNFTYSTSFFFFDTGFIKCDGDRKWFEKTKMMAAKLVHNRQIDQDDMCTAIEQCVHCQGIISIVAKDVAHPLVMATCDRDIYLFFSLRA